MASQGPCRACQTVECHHRRGGRARAAKADTVGARSPGGSFARGMVDATTDAISSAESALSKHVSPESAIANGGVMRKLTIALSAYVSYIASALLFVFIINIETGGIPLDGWMFHVKSFAMPWTIGEGIIFAWMALLVGIIGGIIGAIVAWKLTQSKPTLVTQDVAALGGAFRRAWRRL